jgi:hypothetical protein
MIGVVLEQAPDQSADGNSGVGSGIALVRNPANEVVGLEIINCALQIPLGSG